MRVLMERLILFDIDGTLTRTHNGYLPFNEAIQKTFVIDGDIRSDVPDGNTDPMIVNEIFARANLRIDIQQTHWQDFSATLGECYKNAVRHGTTMIRPLPGAMELVRALYGSEHFHPSIVTGNFEVTAEIKLESAGLLPYLLRGAYASDSHHRPDLPQIARTRWQQRTGRSLHAEQCVVIGDTPKDLAAARHNQMKCVLVGTGRYPVEELRYCEPDECVADLADTESILTLLSNI
jgi:phosphoglycolate phosphatase